MLDWLQDHPLWKTILGVGAIVIAVFSLFGTIASLLWFFQDMRDRDIAWLEEDVEWNEDLLRKLDIVIATQAEIKRELATQSQSLQALLDRQDRASSDFVRVLTTLLFELGTHAGHHELADQPDTP